MTAEMIPGAASSVPHPDPAVGLRPAPAPEPTIWARLGSPQRTPLLLGLLGSALMALGSFGGGGVLVEDPVLTEAALGAWRYGHGHDLAVALVSAGLLGMAYAWVRL